MYKFFCEVNKAWSEASLVWLGSFIKACEGCIRREETSLVIWCEGDEWIEGYADKVSQIVRGVIECEVRAFSVELPRGIDVSSRCIPESSVGIAISRIKHLNEMICEDSDVTAISSAPSSYEGLYNRFKRNVYIHCDVDGIFTEWFNLDSYIREIEGISLYGEGEYLVGVNEYHDIYPALASSHSRHFMSRLQKVYLNCGFIAFCNFKPIDVADLYKFLSSSDSYCLEQDYLNVTYNRYTVSPNYNFTFRKKKLFDINDIHVLPYFVHYYGESKPFLANPAPPDDSDIYCYWGEWYYMVLRIKGLLSEEFLSTCKENYVLSCRY